MISKCKQYLLDIKLPLVFVVEVKVALFRVERFFILFQTQLPALIDNGVEEVVLLVATTNQLVALAVVDVQEIVGVLAGVLDQLRWEWPEKKVGVAYHQHQLNAIKGM